MQDKINMILHKESKVVSLIKNINSLGQNRISLVKIKSKLDEIKDPALAKLDRSSSSPLIFWQILLLVLVLIIVFSSILVCDSDLIISVKTLLDHGLLSRVIIRDVEEVLQFEDWRFRRVLTQLVSKQRTKFLDVQFNSIPQPLSSADILHFLQLSFSLLVWIT